MKLFYEEDLAYIHHIGFSEFARGAGAELLKLFSKAGFPKDQVIDLGCGSGIWAQLLTQQGFTVLGIDLSEAMIALAQDTAPDAQFLCTSLYDIDLPPCVAVTALGEVLNYRSAAHTPNLNLLRQTFLKVAKSLEPGGLFIFDMIVHSNDEAPMRYRTWKTGENWAVLTNVEEHRSQYALSRDITLFREMDGHYRRSEERHHLVTFDASDIESLLVSAGFQVKRGPRYGRYLLNARHMGFIAQKFPVKTSLI